MMYQKRTTSALNLTVPALLQRNTSAANTRLEMVKMFNIYEGAMKEISTKLEILDSEFQTLYDHNPIHHMESRIKSLESILEKMNRKGLEPTLSNIFDHIHDVVGLRIICHYIDDIYKLADLLCQMDSITVIRKTDYIQDPKANGYRSLHLVVRIPVALSDHVEMVAVEIQLRTIAMDMWASLEHELHYKSSQQPVEHLGERLRRCAVSLADIDLRMQEIFDHLHQQQDGEDQQLNS